MGVLGDLGKIFIDLGLQLVGEGCGLYDVFVESYNICQVVVYIVGVYVDMQERCKSVLGVGVF